MPGDGPGRKLTAVGKHDPSNPALNPMLPDAERWQRFLAHEADAPDHPGVLVMGASRARMYPDKVLAEAVETDKTAICNLGVAGSLVQEVWYYALNTSVDLSGVHTVVIPSLGLNNLNWTDDSTFELAWCLTRIIKALLKECAPDARVVVTGLLGEDVVPDGSQFTWARVEKLNRNMDSREEGTGLFDWVEAPSGFAWDDETYVRDDGMHFTPAFYGEFINPLIHDALFPAMDPAASLWVA